MSASVSMLPLYVGVYNRLTGDATLNGLVGGRIRLVEAPQDMALPMLLFSPTDASPDRYFGTGGDDQEDVNLTFQIDVYVDAEASTGDAAATIHDRVIAIMDCLTITVAGYVNVCVKANDYGNLAKEDDAYRITSRWTLSATPV